MQLFNTDIFHLLLAQIKISNFDPVLMPADHYSGLETNAMPS